MSNYPLYDNVGPFPGNGYPVAPDDRNAALSAWGRLTQGKMIGKADVLFYDADKPGSQKSEVDIVNIGGEHADAQPIILTLGSPLVVPQELATAVLNQNITGEVTNFGMRQYAALGVDFPGTSGPIAWPLLEAVIQWGVGGVQCEAVVDFVNGLTVNLTASFVRVNARVASTQRSGVTGTTAAYVLSGFVGPGFTTARVAQKTVYLGQVEVVDGVGESEVFSVPRFAKHARLVGIANGASPPLTVGTIRFWQSPDGVLGNTNVGNFFFSGNNNAPVEIPNGAMYASVVNGQGADAEYAIVYDLAV